MKPSVFISRSASRSKEFVQILNKFVTKVTSQSLIHFELVEAPILPTSGWLFFYSQTGVDFFLSQHDVALVSQLDLRIGTFGPKTGDYLESKGLEIHFRGSGDINTTAESFLKKSGAAEITFIRGVNSLHSMKGFLPADTIIRDMMVYDNNIDVCCPLSFHDILVFTSPMNFHAYQNSNEIADNQAIVTIGVTTAMAALDAGVHTIHIAENPSMEGLAQTVIDQIQNSTI